MYIMINNSCLITLKFRGSLTEQTFSVNYKFKDFTKKRWRKKHGDKNILENFTIGNVQITVQVSIMLSKK